MATTVGAAPAADKEHTELEEVLRDRLSLVTVKEMAMRLRRQQLQGTEAIAEATAKTLRTVVSAARYWRLDELVHMIRTVGRYLQDALPSEPVIGNITRLVLFLLLEEERAAKNMNDTLPTATARAHPHPSVIQSLAALSVSLPGSPAISAHKTSESVTTPLVSRRSFSISDLVFAGNHGSAGNSTYPSPTGTPKGDMIGSPLRSSTTSDSQCDGDEEERGGPSAYQLKPLLIQAMQELIDELETVDTNIAKDARDHIHSGEVILTLGDSSTVQSFLRAAGKHRKFITVVPESAPSFSGHTMARALSSAGMSVLLVPDSNMYALMPRVSKVILGARCILSNGGILAPVGSKAVALAAQANSTPVVALGGVYKISPDWTWVGPERLTEGNQGPVSQIVNYVSSRVIAEDAEIANPLWDYVGPSEIDVIITNVGEHPSSYVYRLIQENYHDEDLEL